MYRDTFLNFGITLTVIAGIFTLGFTQQSENTSSDRLSHQESPEKWGLIIAIAEYPKEGGWTPISAQNDIPLIYNAMVSQGFPEENILVLRDEEATKQGIIDAFNSHLVENAEEGDIAFVHFSSHGQQMFDESGDEIDGYDEAIVPYDAGLRYITGSYEGQNHLNDDELGELFRLLREKLGPDGSVLSVLDACHSGTATRGAAKARGSKTLMEPYGYRPKTEFMISGESFMGDEVAEGEAELSPMVVISGASADQLNYETRDAEGKGVGSLSFTLSKVLTEVDGSLSYRDLFDRVKIEMNKLVPNQTPQIEGDMDLEVFGGNVIRQEPYFIPLTWYEDEGIKINAGLIHGFTVNSTVEIYDFSVQDFSSADPIATGTVQYTTALDSDIAFDEIFEEFSSENVKVIMASRSYEGLGVNVQLVSNMEESLREELKEKLSASPVISMVDENADIIIEDTMQTSRGSAFNIVTSMDQLIYESEYDRDMESVADKITDRIERYIKADFLRKLELSSSALNVQLEMIPFDYEMRLGNPVITKTYDLQEFMDETGNIRLEEGRGFKLKVTNNGTKQAYFTIANFTPSGEAQLVVPYGGRQLNDFTIEPGKSIELDQLLVTQSPYGNEVLKLFATEEPLDLSSVLDPIATRSATGAANNPFQMLLEDGASKTRSAPLGVPPSTANIYSVSFTVVPAQQ